MPKTQSRDDELLSRTRRIETRLTQLMVGLGVPTHAQRPVFDPAAGSVVVPSPHTSLKEIVDSILPTWQGGSINVFVGTTWLCCISAAATQPIKGPVNE